MKWTRVISLLMAWRTTRQRWDARTYDWQRSGSRGREGRAGAPPSAPLALAKNATPIEDGLTSTDDWI